MTPEQQILFDKLTQLQQRVATNVLAGMSQRAAYVHGGGSAEGESSIDTAASAVMRNFQVKAFMAAMKKEIVDEAIMSREEAMRVLSLIGRTHLKDIVKFRTVHVGQNAENGDDLHQTAWTINEDLQATNDERLIIISDLEVGKHGPKIKTHSPLVAIKQLAEMQGWNAAQKFEHSGKDGGPIMTSHNDFYSDDPDAETES